MEQKRMTREEFEKLPLKERIILTASSKLIKKLRAFEIAGLINRDDNKGLIGCVKKLVSLANGEEPKEEKKKAN